VADRGTGEAITLFHLLTRSDASVFPTDTVAGNSQRSVYDFLRHSLRAYWSEFVNLSFFKTLALGGLTNKNTFDVGTDPTALAITDVYLMNTDQGNFNERTPLERVDFGEIRDRQLLNPGEFGTPEAWSAVKRINSDEIWDIYTHPQDARSFTLEIHYRAEMPLSTSGPIVSFGALTDAEFFWVVQMAAARGALAIGRLEDVALILQGVPDAVLLRAGLDLQEAMPSLRPQDVTVG